MCSNKINKKGGENCMEDLYSQRLRKKALRIIKDPPITPITNCSVCCHLASGQQPPDSGNLTDATAKH